MKQVCTARGPPSALENLKSFTQPRKPALTGNTETIIKNRAPTGLDWEPKENPMGLFKNSHPKISVPPPQNTMSAPQNTVSSPVPSWVPEKNPHVQELEEANSILVNLLQNIKYAVREPIQDLLKWIDCL